MSKNNNILSTKKLLDNQKQLLLNANFNVMDVDFISIENKKINLSVINNSIIFTSQNAVNSLLNNPDISFLKTKNTFCVGSKTKEILEKNGFNVVAYTGYAEDLAEIISLVYGDDSYTFFSGNLRKDILPSILTQNGISFNEIETYTTHLTPQKIDGSFNKILFFSPSGVESYLQKNSITNQICFAIGNTTAQALQDKNIKNIMIAQKPTIEDLIEEVVSYKP